jgi:hypothetical protein
VKNIIIKSDVKIFFCNPETGANIGLERYGREVIQRFDLAEFKEAYGDPAPEVIDIIDIGYWWKPVGQPDAPDTYEPPLWHQRGQAAA